MMKSMRKSQNNVDSQLYPKDEPVIQPNINRSALFRKLFETDYQIISTPRHLMYSLVGCALLFLVLGIWTFYMAHSVQNIQVNYAEERICLSSGLETQKCSVKFKLIDDMKGPIYLLYSVQNLYTNHRNFLNSYSKDQLAGKTITLASAENQCGNYIFNKDIASKKSWSGTPLQQEAISSLCGAKPQGYFNDTFFLYSNGILKMIDQSSIFAGKSIATQRGVNSEINQWIDPESQKFKLYMLDGALLTKKRLWGVIKEGLPAGEHQLLVENNYQMAGMKIKKGIQLTNANIMGGKQYFFCVCFFVFFALCIGYLVFLQLQLGGYQKLIDHRNTLISRTN